MRAMITRKQIKSGWSWSKWVVCVDHWRSLSPRFSFSLKLSPFFDLLSIVQHLTLNSNVLMLHECIYIFNQEEDFLVKKEACLKWEAKFCGPVHGKLIVQLLHVIAWFKLNSLGKAKRISTYHLSFSLKIWFDLSLSLVSHSHNQLATNLVRLKIFQTLYFI